MRSTPNHYIHLRHRCFFFFTYQYATLDEAKKAHPDASWWIKGDGCDVVEGLGESTKKKWSGDVDLADGDLQQSYKSYMQQLEFAGIVGLPPRSSRDDVGEDLQAVYVSLTQDLETVYSRKFYRLTSYT